MNIKDLKKGDTVYIYTSDTRNRNYEAKVVSIGRKYITIDNPQWMNQFGKETLQCVQWGAYSLYPGTEQQYNEYKQNKGKIAEVKARLKEIIEGLSLEQVQLLLVLAEGIK